MKSIVWASFVALSTKCTFAAHLEKRDGCGSPDANLIWTYLQDYPKSASSYCASYLSLTTSTVTTTETPVASVTATITNTVETEVTETTTSETTITDTVTSTFTTTTTTSIPFITGARFQTLKVRDAEFWTPNSHFKHRDVSTACSCFMSSVDIAPVTATQTENTQTRTLTATTIVTSTDTTITTTYKTDTSTSSIGVSTTATQTATSTVFTCPNFTSCPNPIGSTPFEIIVYADVNTQWNCQSPTLSRAVTNGLTVDFLEVRPGTPIQWTFQGNNLLAYDGISSGFLSINQEDDPDNGDTDFTYLFVGLQGQAYNPKLECQVNPDTSQLTCNTTTNNGDHYNVFGMDYQDLRPYGQGTHFFMEFGTIYDSTSVYSYPIYAAASCPSIS